MKENYNLIATNWAFLQPPPPPSSSSSTLPLKCETIALENWKFPLLCCNENALKFSQQQNVS